MKSTIKILTASVAAICLLASCQRQEIETPVINSSDPAAVEYSFNISVSGENTFGTSETKAVKNAWESGDRIFIFFKPENGGIVTDGYLTLAYDGSKWNQNSSVKTSLGYGGRLAAVYVPFLGSEVKPVYADNAWSIDGGDVFYSSFVGGYEVVGSSVGAKLLMKIAPGYVQFFMSDASAGDRMICNRVDSYDCVSISSDLSFSEKKHPVNEMTGRSYKNGVVFYGKLNASAGTGVDLTLYHSKDIYKRSLSGTTLQANTAYNVLPLNVQDDSFVKWDKVASNVVSGLFSISQDKSVRFAAGNLVADQSGVYSFAPSQYAEGGSFTWGENSVGSTMPSNDSMDWGPFVGPSWFTLSVSQWNYLLLNRTTLSGARFCMGKVNGVKGILLFPDSWVNEGHIDSATINVAGSTYDKNVFGDATEPSWTELEKTGVVFLPETTGCYWTCDPDPQNNTKAMSILLNSAVVGGGQSVKRVTPNPVRLVCTEAAGVVAVSSDFWGMEGML